MEDPAAPDLYSYSNGLFVPISAPTSGAGNIALTVNKYLCYFFFVNPYQTNLATL